MIKQSIVAIAGLIIPAPLAIAPILKLLPSSSVILNAFSFEKLSVVIIADAAALGFFAFKSKSFIPSIIFCFGSLTPITPVELITGFIISLQFSRISFISSIPDFPVIAFAFLALISTKLVLKSPFTLKCRMGAAVILFVVNTEAISHSFSLYIKAMSFAPSAFKPALIPSAKKP